MEFMFSEKINNLLIIIFYNFYFLYSSNNCLNSTQQSLTHIFNHSYIKVDITKPEQMGREMCVIKTENQLDSNEIIINLNRNQFGYSFI